jgi:hypothetical protein
MLPRRSAIYPGTEMALAQGVCVCYAMREGEVDGFGGRHHALSPSVGWGAAGWDFQWGWAAGMGARGRGHGGAEQGEGRDDAAVDAGIPAAGTVMPGRFPGGDSRDLPSPTCATSL